jgi:hypothetical protein
VIGVDEHGGFLTRAAERLIACGAGFDRAASYRDNIIVSAHPTART